MVHIWDIRGKSVRRLKAHNASVTSAAFSNDGAMIAMSSSQDNTAKIWNARTLPNLFTLRDQMGPVSFVHFSPDGRRVVAASDKTIRIFDARTGEVLERLFGHDGDVTAAVFNEDGTKIISASRDGTARLWALDQRPVLALGSDPSGASADFSHDGLRLVTAQLNEGPIVWDLNTGKPALHLAKLDQAVSSIAFSPDDKQIAVASFDDNAYVYDAQNAIMC
jgi:WD40 repeat protein